MSIADLRQRQKGGVRALTNFEVPEKAGAWNTLAILAYEVGYFFAKWADLEGPKTRHGSTTMSYRHPEMPDHHKPQIVASLNAPPAVQPPIKAPYLVAVALCAATRCDMCQLDDLGEPK